MEHSPPPFFKRGPTPLVRLLLCSLLSIALLIADARYRYLDDIRRVAAVIVYPLQRLAAAPGEMLARIGEFFVAQSTLHDNNLRLAEQNLLTGAKLQKYNALAAENAHLRELLAARQRFPERTIAAEVLYAGRDPFTRKIIIDKGEQHGIKAGQPAIDQFGVIGQVTRVYPWLAEITLVTDKEQLVPVQNVRNGLRAVLGGTGSTDQLELKFIPLNADFQNGYAHEPEAVAESVKLCIATGVAGLSIEDNTGDASKPLYEDKIAVARIEAARRAIDQSGIPVVLTARCEASLVGHPNAFDFALKRLTEFAEAGADCLYAPGVQKPDEIAQIVKTVAPKPLNLLVSGFNHQLSLSQLADLGVRRISVGSGLALAAWGTFLRAAKDIKTNGTFDLLAKGAASADLNKLFQEES